MHKKFEINRTKIKGGCQSGRKVETHNSKSDLPLGLGDRHASNILISLTNGKSIAIDFGYSFGSAFMLDIPELAPFRFTPMIQGLMYPFRQFGLFKDTMVSMLQKLQVILYIPRGWIQIIWTGTKNCYQ